MNQHFVYIYFIFKAIQWIVKKHQILTQFCESLYVVVVHCIKMDSPLTSSPNMLFAFSYHSPKHTSFESAHSAALLSSHQQQHVYSPDSWASDPMYHRIVSNGLYAMFMYTFEEQGYLSDDEPLRESNKLCHRHASLEQDCTDELHLEAELPSPAAEQPQQLCGDWTWVLASLLLWSTPESGCFW